MSNAAQIVGDSKYCLVMYLYVCLYHYVHHFLFIRICIVIFVFPTSVFRSVSQNVYVCMCLTYGYTSVCVRRCMYVYGCICVFDECIRICI